MHSKTFVQTKDIKTAIQGREIDVLQALGVGWESGQKNHIRCPFPNHDDIRPSWRWDEEKAIGFCSCSDRSFSIFDIVMKIKSIDFDSSKLQIAELMGWHDLIKTKRNGNDRPSSSTSGYGSSGQNNKRLPRQHTESLLNWPFDRQDPGLYQRYVGSRLGIAPSEVIMPTSLVVGIDQLPYWADQKTKIGNYPCVVVELIDPLNKRPRHAHRIYLNQDGTDKAQLPGGLEPKKLCAVQKDQSVAGLVCYWGTPETAKHCFVGEGCETMAAVAQAYRDEVERGEIVIASAISGPGLRRFNPWPIF
jgi:hypothetical protein